VGLDQFEFLLEKAIRESGAPGAAVAVGDANEILYHDARGFRRLFPTEQPVEIDTLYDMASLTKVVATTTAVMLLRDEGVWDLDQPVSEIIPLERFKHITIRHLLTHTSGLPSYYTWYHEISGPNAYLQRIAETDEISEPGQQRTYSDLGFILLGRAVEYATRDNLAAFCRKRIFEPLGMLNTTFNPPEAWQERAAATEQCAWRGEIIQGQVHDENAYAIGGISGHAGLFSTAEDVARFCQGLYKGELVSRSTLEEMACPGQVATYPWQGLGWKVDPWRNGAEGYLATRSAIGHTGWTGTALWLDTQTGFYTILLSNTAHPSRTNRDSRRLRQVFFNGVSDIRFPDRANVHTGLDRISWNNYSSVLNKRVALLTHYAAVDFLGRNAMTALMEHPEVQLKLLFSPEHGLFGQAEAGEKVNTQAADIPVISLYGQRRKPSLDELKDIDLFLVDMQDVGARYYTYMATMKDCLEACAEAETPVMVLDRPNPLGGEVIEGNLPEQTGSLVCAARIPVRHGMTMGELAQFFKATEPWGDRLQLSVSSMDGWQPTFYYHDCQLPWAPPSPNMPTPEAALIYIGTCLFEGVNMNEGRGTDHPFQWIGAPWLDAVAVLSEMNPVFQTGCTLEVISYTPASLPGRSTNPRYLDEVCGGISIIPRNRKVVRAWALTLDLLQAVRKVHPDKLQFSRMFDTLTGGPAVRTQLEAGKSAQEIINNDAAELARFDMARPRLYKSENEHAI